MPPSPKVPMPALDRTISVIRESQRKRNDLLKVEVALTLTMKAICRRTAGVNPADDAKTKAAKMKQAAAYYADVEAGKVGETVGVTWEIKLARDGIEGQRKSIEKQLTKAAETLPVFLTFVKPLNGMGALGLGQIIGEAGDLSMYAGPAKLWKRMCMGSIGSGEIQQKFKDAAKAKEAGYSPKRRSVMFVIGDSLIKKENAYRDLYLARKQYECEQFAAKGLPVLTEAEAKESKAKAGTYTTAMHAHRRAKRYMEKRLLRDLWRAWRALHQLENKP